MNVFDKFANIHFQRTDGSHAEIITPQTGRKPTIRVQGRLVAQDILQQVEIRLTNFVTDVPLSDYGTLAKPGKVTVEAGYKGSVNTAFTGQIVNSFQELPGPDGITVFQMIIGNADNWNSINYTNSYVAGTSFKSILSDIAGVLFPEVSSPLDYHGADYSIPMPLSKNCLAKDWFPELRALYGHTIFPWGERLEVYKDTDGGTGNVWPLDMISHAKHSAAGFDIQAPWVPGIIPGDTLEINPQYFRQDFGGSTVAPGNHFQIFLIDFEFCTDDDTSNATYLTVGAQ